MSYNAYAIKIKVNLADLGVRTTGGVYVSILGGLSSILPLKSII
jgi:hypothetical protein